MLNLKAVGTDTEVFVVDMASHSIIPVIGLIGGTKQKPRPLDDLGSAVQEDNVMLEFNTIPARTVEEFNKNINKVLTMIFDELRAKNLDVSILPHHVFNVDDLKHPQAQEIGCESDFNAWRVEENLPLSARRMKTMRTCGGHVHVSFDDDGVDPSFTTKVNLARALDIHLGLPAVLLDLDNVRRKFYGKPGAMRFKAADRIEYRTLSNFWISTPQLTSWVFNQVKNAISFLDKLPKEEYWFPEDTMEIIDAVSKGNRKEALKLVQKYKVDMPNA